MSESKPTAKIWALKFSSTGTPDKAYMKCGTNPALKFGGNKPYTLTAEVCLGDSNGALMGCLKGSNWDGSGVFQGYGVLPLGDRIRAYRTGDPYDCDSDKISYLNRWIYLVAVFDGNTLSIHLDDKCIASKSGFTPITPAPDNYEFLVGTAYRGTDIGNCFHNALVRSISVMDDAVAPEKAKAVQNGMDPKSQESPLVALWDFTTQSTKDLTGNGNDGTLVGKAKLVQVDVPL